MLRILIVASELPPGPGGIGAHAAALAEQLDHGGHDILALGCQHYVTTEQRDAFNGAFSVTIRPLGDAPDPARTAALRARQLRRAIRSFRPDVVVASGGRILWLADLVCGRVPYVAIIHGTELGGSVWSQRLTRRAIDRAASVVAVSQFTRSHLDRLGVTNRNISVIPNGADAERFHPDAGAGQWFREAHRFGDAPLIVTVGNVTERKGQHAVVRALPHVLEQTPDAQYALVGQPSESAAILALAGELGVADHVHLIGQVDPDQIVGACNAADVFAMTSTTTASGDIEGFGIAVVEAALCRTPAVVSAGTGAQEAIVEGVTGLAVDAEDPESVAGALTALLTDPARRARMGGAAERLSRESMTWVARAPAYEEVLEQAARRKAAAGRRIVVVSHTPHFRTPTGEIVGFGPTLRELDQLAGLFDELVHVAPVHPGEPPGSSLPYASGRIRFSPVPPAGGPSSVDRLRAFAVVPTWAYLINRELRSADVAHVRCPAGIGMVALGVLLLRRRPRARWVKYAGNWRPDQRDAWTYRIQRWWLRRGLARAKVTVNGRWSDDPPFVHPFDNPTLSPEELARGASCASAKSLNAPFHLAFVGRVEDAKGPQIALEAARLLTDQDIPVRLTIVGEGPLKADLERRAAELGLDDQVELTGPLPRADVEEVLCSAHLLVLPTVASEGFPKVIGEGFAFGAVPVTSGVSSIAQVLAETGAGVVVAAEPNAIADACARLLADASEWTRHRDDGVAAAQRWSYQTYLERVQALLGLAERAP